MRVHEAIALINEISYKPGWTFTPEDYTKRFEDTVLVKVGYPAPNSDAEFAPDYKQDVLPVARAQFPLIVGDVTNRLEFYRRIMDIILKIEEHEAREFFGVDRTYFDKPFHPHTLAGMQAWCAVKDSTSGLQGSIFTDIMFGA